MTVARGYIKRTESQLNQPLVDWLRGAPRGVPATPSRGYTVPLGRAGLEKERKESSAAIICLPAGHRERRRQEKSEKTARARKQRQRTPGKSLVQIVYGRSSVLPDDQYREMT